MDDEPESLLRKDLTFLDLIAQREEPCEARLEVTPGHIHDCTRPLGHSGQHYSFSGHPSYEIIWPATSQPVE